MNYEIEKLCQHIGTFDAAIKHQYFILSNREVETLFCYAKFKYLNTTYGEPPPRTIQFLISISDQWEGPP